MRLIDADELKETLFIHFGNQLPDGIFKIIDKIPMVNVDMDFAKECYANGYEDGNSDKSNGHWIPTPDDFAEFKCSICDKPNFWEDNFCPNCGADMRGDDNG